MLVYLHYKTNQTMNKKINTDSFLRTYLIVFGIFALVIYLTSCGNSDTQVKSPFSRLDTVKTEAKEKAPEKENGNGIKSPFSGLDKK